MPYIKKEKRIKMHKDSSSIGDVGDLNYAYSLIYITLWTKTQSYKTIEFIAGIGLGQETPQFILDLDRVATRKGFNQNEIKRAKFLAFQEFMRRVGNNYEDVKITENGDIYGGVPYGPGEVGNLHSVSVLNPGAKQRGRKKNNG